MASSLGSLGSFLFLLFLCLILSLLFRLLLLQLLFLLLRGFFFNLGFEFFCLDLSIALILLLILLLLLVFLVFLLTSWLLNLFLFLLTLRSGTVLTFLLLKGSLLLLLGLSLLLLLEVLLLLLVFLLLLDGLLALVKSQVGSSLSLLLSLRLSFALTIGKLLEFGDVEAVHVVDMRVDAAGEVERGVEALVLVLGEPGHADLLGHADLYQLDVAGSQGVVNHPFILFNCDRAG